MANATTTTRLFKRMRLRSASCELDLADCGTTLGLDLALQPEEAPAAAAPRTVRNPGWWRRLGARRFPVNS